MSGKQPTLVIAECYIGALRRQRFDKYQHKNLILQKRDNNKKNPSIVLSDAIDLKLEI